MSWWSSSSTSRKPTWSENSNSNGDQSNAAIILDVVKFVVYAGLTLYISNRVLKQITKALEAVDSDPQASAAARTALAKRLRRPEIETMDFDTYEMRLLPEVIGPEEISTGFSDVGGLEEAIDEVKDNVVLPLQIWKYHKSYATISPCPAGVLLYGPPGTGKSLIAKAIAKEAGATFISIKANTILDKYVGESERMASAIFKLGRKLAPSIIFIDEIETLLQKRRGDSAHVVSSMQGIFLSEWDGLVVQRQQELQTDTSFYHGPVVVLGATNRPQDLDPAFLRRMPVKLSISLPNAPQRLAIFHAQLRNEEVEEDVSLETFAELMEGCTGADIKELIRLACLNRTKEMTALAQKRILEDQQSADQKAAPSTMEHGADQHHHKVWSVQRPLNQDDFNVAFKKAIHRDSNMNAFEKRQNDANAKDALNAAFLSMLSH